ncbi:MAG: ribonuclease H-like domain-containing protein [archaeon GB-1867-005]|nr:ribonuclease H-like domain-containing protein [Candidatus Culexmicrobium cathedralense]
MVVAFDIETTGLNPLKNVVILIGVKKGKQLIQWKIWEYGSEDKIILEFMKYIESVDPYDAVIIGYNALKF